MLFAVPNGEERHPAVARMLTGFDIEHRRALPEEDALMPGGQGVLPGVNDLILLAPGASVTLIELKVEGDNLRGIRSGVQSKEQKRYAARCAELGLDYRIIRNTTEFWDLCAEKGVKLRIERPWQIKYPAPVLPPIKARASAAPRARAATKVQSPTQPPAVGGADQSPPTRQSWGQ